MLGLQVCASRLSFTGFFSFIYFVVATSLFLGTVSVSYILGWPSIHCVAKDGLELLILEVSKVLGFQACAITPDDRFFLVKKTSSSVHMGRLARAVVWLLWSLEESLPTFQR